MFGYGLDKVSVSDGFYQWNFIVTTLLRKTLFLGLFSNQQDKKNCVKPLYNKNNAFQNQF